MGIPVGLSASVIETKNGLLVFGVTSKAEPFDPKS